MIAFVLGGGGARGALQVGALRALWEAGIRPDLIVGTSIGAVNAAFIALRDWDSGAFDELTRAWEDATRADLLPVSALRLITSALFRQSGGRSYQRMRDFFMAHGLTPELRFGDARTGRLIVVATDLNAGAPVLYGQDLQECVLDAVLASVALPPWILPIEGNERLMMDGGVVSSLPIEPAMRLGATEIVALDLTDRRVIPAGTRSILSFLVKLSATVQQRQIEMELAAAAAAGVPVRHVALRGELAIPVWDFRYTRALIARGYELTQHELANWGADQARRVRPRLPQSLRGDWLERLAVFQSRIDFGRRRIVDFTQLLPRKLIHPPTR